jgi:hypothetical protein
VILAFNFRSADLRQVTRQAAFVSSGDWFISIDEVHHVITVSDLSAAGVGELFARFDVRRVA